MKRRTLLAAAGGATLFGGAGCYGLAAMTDDDQENNDDNSNTSENGSESSQSNGSTSEGNNTSEETTDQESNESDTESNDSEDGDPQADNESTETNDNESTESESTSRPEDPVNTISVRDDGLDVSPSPEKGVDEEIYCYATFDVGEYDLRKVRIDAVALATDGTRLDHAWKPFMQLDAGDTFDVEFRFFVSSDEIYEYLIGATEAQYADS